MVYKCRECGKEVLGESSGCVCWTLCVECGNKLEKEYEGWLRGFKD